MWLNMFPSKNDHCIISYFYVNCTSNLKCVSRTIRGDRGSKNVVVAGMQWNFRGEHQDSMSGHSSFFFGSSTNNQRIESWWSILKRQNSDWWINFLSLNHHKECMKFCFSGILQSELDNIKEMWNNHHIRNSRNTKCPGGRPNVLYFNPAAAGATDYKLPLPRENLDQALRFCV